MRRILFVCQGNICRSPALEGAFKQLVKERGLENQFFIDSAATTPFFLGCKADERMCAAAKKRGIEIHTTAKLFQEEYFQEFDLIFVVTQELLEQLKDAAANSKESKKIHLVTEFSAKYPYLDIPDPYYQKERAFDLVMDMAIDACETILKDIEK